MSITALVLNPSCRYVISDGENLAEDVKLLFIDKCPLGVCYGTNRTPKLEWDADLHTYIETGETEPCPHTL